MNARFLFLRTTGLFIAWMSACNVLAQEPTPAENQAAFEQYSIVNAEWFKEAPGDEALRKLLKGRYVEAVTVLQLQQWQYEGGRADFGGYLEASEHVLQAGLELGSPFGSKPEDKLAILSRYIAVVKQVEALTMAKKEGGAAVNLDVSLARYQRIDAEIQLLRAKHEAANGDPAAAHEELATLEGANVSPDDDEQQKLLKQRYLDAVGVMQMKQSIYESGRGDYGGVLEATKDVVQAELELATKPKEKIAILLREVESTKQVEDLIRKRGEGGTASNLENHQARYQRMDAEIRLLRAKEELEKSKSKNAGGSSPSSPGEGAIADCSSIIAGPCHSSRPCRVPWRARIRRR